MVIDVAENKQKFLQLVGDNIFRGGLQRLLDWLESTDFFTAPCSTKYHLNVEGGLCQHSLDVYEALKGLFYQYAIPTTHESLAIVALFHDLCKVNYYKRYYEGNQLKYRVDDQLPLDHGEKSVMLLQRFIELTDEEMVAIRWHIGAYDEAVQGSSYSFNTAIDKYPLATLLQCADMLASKIIEK